MRAPFIIYGGMLVIPAVIASGRAAGPVPAAARAAPPAAARGSPRSPARCGTAPTGPRPRANLADGFAAFGVRAAIVPLFVRDVLHRSAVWTGIGFGVVAVLNAATLLPAGRLADRLGRRPVIVAGCLRVGGGHAHAARSCPGLAGISTALAVLGLGSGLLDVAPAAMLGDILGGQGGTVVASYQMAGDIGAVTGPVTAGYLVDAASYGAAFGLAAGVLGAGRRARPVRPGDPVARPAGRSARQTRWRDGPSSPGRAAGGLSRPVMA